jgi:hypothetical protein
MRFIDYDALEDRDLSAPETVPLRVCFMPTGLKCPFRGDDDVTPRVVAKLPYLVPAQPIKCTGTIVQDRLQGRIFPNGPFPFRYHRHRATRHGRVSQSQGLSRGQALPALPVNSPNNQRWSHITIFRIY